MENEPQKNNQKSFWRRHLLLILIIIYLIWPIDIIPEFLAPFIGPFVLADDIGIVGTGLLKFLFDLKKSRKDN